MRKFYLLDLRSTHKHLTYDKFLEVQEAEWEKRLLNLIPDTLVSCYHLPTITLGARPIKEQLAHLKPIPREWLEEPEEELFKKSRDFLKGRYGVNLVKTGRGGSLWYHDDGVLNLYLIANVPSGFPSEVIQPLEEALFQTVAAFGLNPERKTERWRHEFQNFIGVWVGGRKIAGIGIRLRKLGRRTISLFGAALNVNPDKTNISLIEPCGIDGAEATSLYEECLKKKRSSPVENAVLLVFLRKFQEVFQAEFPQHTDQFLECEL